MKDTTPQPTPPARIRPRVEFVDALRGLAVIFMIVWHTADGWINEEVRSGAGWTAIRLMGGLAAPLFVFLSGVGAAMALADLDPSRRRKVASRVMRRGFQIIALGYLLRLQFWALDSLAILKLSSLCIGLLLFAGWMTVLYALGLFPYTWLPERFRSPPLWVSLVGVALVGAGYSFVDIFFESRLRGVMRVDVLQCIGVSVVAVAWLWRQRDRRVISLALAVSVALLTHAMRDAMPAKLPPFVAGYLAAWPGMQDPWTYFPLFPWMSYALAGAATAVAWKGSLANVGSLTARLAVAVAVGLATYEGFSHVHQLMKAIPEIVQPLRVVYRIAWIFGLSALVQALFTFAAKLPLSPLVTIGRASLLIYWVHLEFAYGISSRPFRKEMSITQWSVGLSFVLLMSYIVAKIRTRKKVAKRLKSSS